MTSTGISWELEPSHSHLPSLLSDRFLSFPFRNIGPRGFVWQETWMLGSLPCHTIQSRIANASTETWNSPQNRFCHIISPINKATSCCAIYIALSTGDAHGVSVGHLDSLDLILAYCRLLGRQASTALIRSLWTTYRAAREDKGQKLYATHGALAVLVSLYWG